MRTKYIKEYMDSILNVSPYNGLIVMKDDKEVFSYFNGLKNEKRQKFSRHTPVFIYSCTKDFTVVATMMLIERGLLNIYDPISKYFPEFSEMRVKNGTKIEKAKNTITIKSLLAMRAGFDYDLNSKEIQKIKSEKEFETQDIVKVLASRPLLFEPDTQYNYSLCHDLLGALIEKVSGLKLSEFMQKYIFEPCGMKETTFHPDKKTWTKMGVQYKYERSTDEAPVVAGQTCPYRLSEKYESGGAGLISTANDLAKFTNALATYKLISRVSTEILRTSDDNTGNWPYALGVAVNKNKFNSNTVAPLGMFGWGGAAGTCPHVSPETGISMIFVRHVCDSLNYIEDERLINVVFAELSREYGIK